MSQRIRIGMFLAVAASAIAVLFLLSAPGKEADEAYIHLLEEDGETAEISSDASEILQEDENAGERDPVAKEEAAGERDPAAEEEAPEGTKHSEAVEEKQMICVYVCGKVKKPGVYELSEDSRLSDFIEEAGGFTKKAAREYLNLARKAEDGQKLYVPSKKEAAALEKDAEGSTFGAEAMQETSGREADSSQTGSRKADGEKVNINTAGMEELMTLSGIGEAKAEAIISYREANGAFRSAEELMQVSGIKEGIYQKISEDITI